MNRATHYDFLNLGQLHAWPIKKVLTEEEADPYGHLNLSRTEAEQHIVKNMSEDQRKHLRKNGYVEIEVRDTDHADHDMKIYRMMLSLKKESRLYGLGNWGLAAMDRKLVKGAEIGMHWSDGKLHFSVLSNTRRSSSHLARKASK